MRLVVVFSDRLSGGRWLARELVFSWVFLLMEQLSDTGELSPVSCPLNKRKFYKTDPIRSDSD